MSSWTFFSPFPLTQRLKISNDITKEKGIYFDSIRNPLPSMRFEQKCENPSCHGVCHCADAQWVTPSLMQFKPGEKKKKDSQFRLNKKDILNIEPNKFSFFIEGNHLSIYFFRDIQIFTHAWLLCYQCFCLFLGWSQNHRGRRYRKLSLTGMQCSSIFCF